MRFARIVAEDGYTGYAIEVAPGMFEEATGCPYEGTLRSTGRTVRPARWLPPVEPRIIFCIGRNYAAHAAEGGSPPPAFPILFMKNLNAPTGHQEPICLPKVCEDEVDFEGELVVVIGKSGRDIPRAQALDHVLGYTIGHDVSARIWQERKGGSQWCRGKSFDTFAPMGPVLVTADEIPDPSVFVVETKLNGQVVQHGEARNMIFDVPALIEFLSQDTTLLAGTVIMTGTPEGVGWARTPKLTLKPGDCADISIAGIGTLSNRVE